MPDQEPPLLDPQEESLQRYFSTSGPSPEFSQKLGAALYQRQVQALPTRPLWVLQALRTVRSWLTPHRAFSPRALGLVLVGLLLVSGTVYALAVASGYIPGFGIVHSNDLIRTIPGPVSQTREGVTITVTQILLTPDRSSVSIAVTGLAQDALVSDNDSLEKQQTQCSSLPKIQMGGQVYGATASKVGEYDANNQYIETYYYNPIPDQGTHAVLVVDCILHTLPGKAPENWSIPLTFVPASADIAILPVTVVTPPVENTQANPGSASPVILENVIEIPDGYVFSGRFMPQFAGNTIQWIGNDELSIRDANGSALSWKPVDELTKTSGDDGVLAWAYQVNEKNISWPVSIQMQSVGVFCFAEGTTFQVDTGANPQPGDTWNDIHNIKSGACSLTIRSIKRTSTGYVLRVDLPKGIRLAGLSIQAPGDHPEAYIRGYQSYTNYELRYPGEIPSGVLQFSVSNVTEIISGNWSVEWQPEAPRATPTP